jgi:hypothetical protein
MSRNANGFMSKAICDRCGLKYMYTQLRREWNGLRTCDDCWSMKHPQLSPIYPPTEPQALQNPRPDRIEPLSVPVGQQIFPFIQNTSTQVIAIVGMATVTTGGP